MFMERGRCHSWRSCSSALYFFPDGRALGWHTPIPGGRVGVEAPLGGKSVEAQPSWLPCAAVSFPGQAGEEVGMQWVAAVNFNSAQPVWLTKSMLGKHSTLLGGEVFGINRRYHHCEATGGRQVARCSSTQQPEPGRGLQGCQPPAPVCSSLKKELSLCSVFTIRVTWADPVSSLCPLPPLCQKNGATPILRAHLRGSWPCCWSGSKRGLPPTTLHWNWARAGPSFIRHLILDL